jgi:hypothetical protein
VRLHAVAVVDTDHLGCAIVEAIEGLDGRHGFAVCWVVVLSMYDIVGCWQFYV